MVPHDIVKRIPEAAEAIARREKVLLDAAQKPGLSIAVLKEAFSRADEFH